MKIINCYTSLLLIFICSSCTTYVKEEIPLPEPKLVINSIFSSDSLFKVQVMLPRRYSNVGQEGFDTLKNAVVEIFKGTQLLEKLLYNNDGFYRSNTLSANDFGSTYSIKVTVPNYPIASSADILPQQPIVGNISYQPYSNSENGKGFEVSIPLMDDATQNDYYFIAAYSKRAFTSTDTILYYPEFEYVTFSDPIEEYNASFKYGFTDRSFNGQTYNMRFNIESQSDSLTMVIGKTSKAFHDYYLSYEKQSLEDNIFSPIVKVANNIKGGYGIFAGYAVRKYRLTR